MTKPPCELIDDYLDGSLPDPERTGFAAHLPACATCRQIVQECERLDETLFRAVVQSAPLPHGLIDRIEGQLLRARRRRRFRTAGLTAAAALLLCVLTAWRLAERWMRPPEQAAPVAEQTPVLADQAIASVAPVHVTFRRPDEVIARRLESKNPDVTIIWVYPAQTTEPYPRTGVPKLLHRSDT
jgi:anti-sigma factor RsiW